MNLARSTLEGHRNRFPANPSGPGGFRFIGRGRLRPEGGSVVAGPSMERSG
jgi:hypothetical protein